MWEDYVNEPKPKITRVGVVVGRFQTPTLTAGHWRVLVKAKEMTDLLFVGVGIHKERSADNPLPYEGSWSVLRDAAILIDTTAAVYDSPQGDEDWTTKLIHNLRAEFGHYPNPKFTYFGGTDSTFLNAVERHVYGAHVVRIPRLSNGPSATDIRKEVRRNPNWANRQFREGVIYATR